MRVPLVLVVNPALPVKTVRELIDHCKANPRKLNFGSGGAGGPDHMAGEYFKLTTGVDILHVAYRGLSPALTDLIGGQIQMVFSTTSAAVQYIKGGQLRALAVTSAERSDAIPEVPVMGDVLGGYEASQWYGLGAPKNTPSEIIATINKEVVAAQADPKVKARLSELGGVPMPMAPAEFGKFVSDDTEKWAKVVKFSGAKGT
jgi:tripartite-type tricarboxylate transporter receptor subunit TctC